MNVLDIVGTFRGSESRQQLMDEWERGAEVKRNSSGKGGWRGERRRSDG